jgi:hypothetical protein
MYLPEGTRPLNLEFFPRGKTSCSPNRNTGLCDILKKSKLNNTKLPMMNSYNNPYKLMDVVSFKFYFNLYSKYFRIN